MEAPRLSLGIVSGRRHGRTIGFRTLNFDLSLGQPGVEYGIYAAWVEINRVRHRAAVHYGPRPVLNDLQPTLEAHLLDVVLSETPREATLELIRRLRDVRDFSSTEALIEQITVDVARTREILGEHR